MLIIRLLLLCLSFFGYVLFFTKKCRVEPAFTPAITVSLVMLIVFLCGIIGILSWSVYLLFGLGLALLCWMLIDKAPTGWKAILTNPALIFLTLSAAYLFLRFYNRVLYSYDDFSHWGVMVKTMLENGALPNSENSFILFQSYPPGSACWIYFVARVLGDMEGIYLFAHAMLTLAFLSPLFGFFQKRRWYDFLLPLAGALLIYTNVLDPNCMGVDVLLAASGLAAVLTIYRYRATLSQHAYLILPLLISPLLIKNSGVFFYALGVAYSLYCLYDQKKSAPRARWITTAVFVIVPICILLLWRNHVAVSFEDGLGSKHALSMENFLSRWQANQTHALEMLQKIAKWIMRPKMNVSLYILGGMIALAAAEAVLRRDKEANKHNVELLLVLVLCSFLYELGVAGMYLFSMPLSEFLYQNGGDYIRYNSTLVDFLLGIAIVWAGRKLKPKKDLEKARPAAFPWVLRVSIFALLLICLLPHTQIQTLAPSYHTALETRVEQIHAAIAESNVESRGSYFVRANEDDVDLAGHMFRYLLFSGDVEATSDSVDSEEIPEIVSFYTAYIDWDADDITVYTAASFEE